MQISSCFQRIEHSSTAPPESNHNKLQTDINRKHLCSESFGHFGGTVPLYVSLSAPDSNIVQETVVSSAKVFLW